MISWYGLLKISSMVATGLFGALGLLTTYKTDDGKITKWGKIALGGILLSSLLSLTLYSLETSREKLAAERAKDEAEATTQQLKAIMVTAQVTVDQQEKSLKEIDRVKGDLSTTLARQELALKTTNKIAEDMKISLAAQQAVLGGNEKILGGVTRTIEKQSEVLSGLDRSINAIKDVVVSWELELPLDDPALKILKENIEKEVALIRIRPGNNTQCGHYNKTRDPWTILLKRNCAPITARPINEVVRSPNYSVLIAFSRDRAITLPDANSVALSDLRFSTAIKYDPNEKEREPPVFQIEYDLQRHSLLLRGIQLSALQLRRNAEMGSIPDLTNSYLRVSSTYNIEGPLGEDQIEKLRLLSLLKLRTLTITINGQNFVFTEKVFNRGMDAKRRLPYFYATLPDSLEQFRK